MGKGSVEIKYGDSQHPKTLLRNTKQKRKALYNFMRGKESHLSGEEIETYSKMSWDELESVLRGYDERIRSLEKGKWNSAKSIDNNRRNAMRAGKTSFFNRGIFTDPSMNPIKRVEKAREQEKKEKEDL